MGVLTSVLLKILSGEGRVAYPIIKPFLEKFIYDLRDYLVIKWKIKQANKESEKKVEELKNAKTESDFDKSVDNL